MRGPAGLGIGLWLLFFALRSEAQSDVQLSQHMFNRQVYNPAVTGASQYVNITANIRDQWIGWEGAPKARILSVHNFFESIRSGAGATIVHNELGLEEQLNVKLLYAYHVRLSENSYLSMGLGGGVLFRYFDRGGVLTENPDDPDFILADLDRKTLADFDFGLEFNTLRFTAGASVTHLTHSAQEKETFFSGRHFYGFARYQIQTGYNWQVEPAFYMQRVKNLTHLELSCLAYYRDRYWFGIAYRFNAGRESESVVPMAGVEVADFLRIGYSYDIHVGGLRKYGHSTHELFVGLRIAKDPARGGQYRTPRFFE
ncbi:MAG: type IX secretion system membrane protein PorP/SprF [Culturomica sp.]|jgi:type IX secretion system PorP/SprF family membrane protein|nr:type IX secretion system membrane protein PorP/SprF [Culturomica sp.]